MATNLQKIKEIKTRFDSMKKEIQKVIVGQDEVIEHVLIAILCDSNALLESYPGLGKTLLIKTISQILDLDYSRIQNTPDLMPSDIIGTYVIEEKKGQKHFRFEQGPIFANIILADEINRATPKTQSALLEAMQEKQVTIGNKTYELDKPFFVLATQNPIDQEGTYPLPEAQTDRFLFKILVDYPKLSEEIGIVEKYTKSIRAHKVSRMLRKDTLVALQKLIREIPIADDIKKKVVELVTKTRTAKDLVEYGASPRASIGLILAAKARALVNGRAYVSIEDVKAMSYPILRHRIILSFNAEREGKTADDVISVLWKK